MTLLLHMVMFACAIYWSGSGVAAQDAPAARVSNPVPIKEVRPEYPQAAKDALIQGEVLLSVVVRVDGTVGDVAVAKSLDSKFGVDEAAVNAVRQWLFEPGKKDGKAVAVRVTVAMAFTLKP